MAKGARQRGVVIDGNGKGRRLRPGPGSDGKVTATKMGREGRQTRLGSDEAGGGIHAEHVVTATGNQCTAHGAALGHQDPGDPRRGNSNIVTEPDPALVELGNTNGEHPVPARRRTRNGNVRDGNAAAGILGPYERKRPGGFEYRCPKTFPTPTCSPLDLERIEEEYMSFIHRLPSSEEVGLKDDTTARSATRPTANPLVGPATGGLRKHVAGRRVQFPGNHGGGRGGALPSRR